MRLLNYLDEYTPLLMEKVSKQEINAMLNSNDVIVGAEFEFISSELKDHIIDNYNAFEDANRDYEYYLKEVQEWENEQDDIKADIERLEKELKNNSGDKELEKELKVAKKDLELVLDNEPEVGEAYVAYMNNYDSSGDGWPPEPPDLNDGDDWRYAVENIINHDKSLPFSNYEIADYHGAKQNLNTSKWVIEPDSSLGMYGIEVKSPPMSLKEFTKMCPKVFKWIDYMGYTDSSCGFHIHMSLKNISSLSETIDINKLILFTDEDYIYKFFNDRKDNDYAISVRKQLEKGQFRKDDWKDIIGKKNIDSKVDVLHYNSINWEGLMDDDEHIEFRYMGSNDYHHKWEKIKVIIAQYAYNLNLACNPNFKKKEYLLKLIRVINKKEDEVKKYLEYILLEMAKKVKDKKEAGVFINAIKEIKTSKIDWLVMENRKKFIGDLMSKWYNSLVFTDGYTEAEITKEMKFFMAKFTEGSSYAKTF